MRNTFLCPKYVQSFCKNLYFWMVNVSGHGSYSRRCYKWYTFCSLDKQNKKDLFIYMEASSCLGLLFQYEVFILFSVSLWKENKSINNFCVYILWHVFGSESTTTSTLNSFIHVSDISCFCTIYYIRSYLLQYWVPPYKWMFYCFFIFIQ